MPTGRVKFFDADKGFGFIRPDERGPDVFLWGEAVRTANLKGLKALQRVSYEIGCHPITGRPCVVKIAAIDETEQSASPSWFRKEALADMASENS